MAVDRLLIPSLLIIISDSVSNEPFEQPNLYPPTFLLKSASRTGTLSVVARFEQFKRQGAVGKVENLNEKNSFQLATAADM